MQEKAKKKTGVLIAAALILALAILSEFGFVRLCNREVDAAVPPGTEQQAARTVPAEEFSDWEFESRGEDAYYALAYNSYFALDGIGGAWVQSVEVYLERSPEDDTETVIYYDAVVDGTRGEYIAPLAKTAQGVYTARLDAEQLYALRIFPTEQVRSTLRFAGVTLNPTVQREGFSIARLILWAFILATIYYLYIFVRNRISKKGRKAPGWFGWYLFLQTAVLFAAFQAPRMFTASAGLETLLLFGGFGGFTLLYGAVWLIACRLRTAHARLAACILVCGALFCFASAPMQAPDEYWHYLRAYSVSCGDFSFDASFEYPDDVQRLVDLFPGTFYKEIQQKGTGSVLERLQRYFAESGTPYTGKRYTTPIQLIYPYLVPALGVLLGRLSGSAIAGFYLGRLASVGLLAICGYFGLKWAKRYRGAVILTALFPLTLFLGSSYSYDGCLLALLLLFLGLLWQERLSWGGVLGMALCFGGIVGIKPLYLPLALLLFTLPKEAVAAGKKGGVRLTRLRAFAALLAVGAAVYAGTLLYAGLVMRGIQPVGNPDGVNVAAQIRYVLSNPVRYALTMAVDGYMNLFYLDGLGLFGWLDANAALTGLLAPVAVVLVAALYADESPLRPKADRWIFAGTAVLVYAVVVTGFYCTWSTLGSTSILGVQSRYFLPVLPCLTGAISAAFGGRLRYGAAPGPGGSALQRDSVAIGLCAALALLGAFELGLLYFLT